jgi:hypothetical protein
LEKNVVLNFGDFGGQGCQFFGDILLVGRDGFSLRIIDYKKIT